MATDLTIAAASSGPGVLGKILESSSDSAAIIALQNASQNIPSRYWEHNSGVATILGPSSSDGKGQYVNTYL